MLLAANNRGSAAAAPGRATRAQQPSRPQPPPPLFPVPFGSPNRSGLLRRRVLCTACCTAASYHAACRKTSALPRVSLPAQTRSCMQVGTLDLSPQIWPSSASAVMLDVQHYGWRLQERFAAARARAGSFRAHPPVPHPGGQHRHTGGLHRHRRLARGARAAEPDAGPAPGVPAARRRRRPRPRDTAAPALAGPHQPLRQRWYARRCTVWQAREHPLYADQSALLAAVFR